MQANATNLSPHPGRKPNIYYRDIDIARFFAALMVMFFHFCYINSNTEYKFLWPFTWSGWVGVEVFFVISGAVIANSANGATATQFLKGRALRLYPSAWICATITFVVSEIIGGSNLLLPYIRSLLLFPRGPWISTVYWTLTVECCFYALIFGFLLFDIFRYINLLAAILTCISAIYLFAVTSGLTRELENLNILLLRHGCMFALGIWIWLSTIRRLRFWERAGVAVAVMSSIAEIRLTGLKFLPRETLGEIHVLTPIAVWCLIVCVISLSMRRATSLRGPYWNWFRALGLMTYPLYLIHDICGQRLIQYLLGLGVQKWTALIVGILSVVLLSLVIVRLEARVRRWLTRVLNWVDADWVTKWITKPYKSSAL